MPGLSLAFRFYRYDNNLKWRSKVIWFYNLIPSNFNSVDTCVLLQCHSYSQSHQCSDTQADYSTGLRGMFQKENGPTLLYHYFYFAREGSGSGSSRLQILCWHCVISDFCIRFFKCEMSRIEFQCGFRTEKTVLILSKLVGSISVGIAPEKPNDLCAC